MTPKGLQDKSKWIKREEKRKGVGRETRNRPRTRVTNFTLNKTRLDTINSRFKEKKSTKKRGAFLGGGGGGGSRFTTESLFQRIAVI